MDRALSLTLPANFIQKVDNCIILTYSHTVEVFSDGIGQLLFALPTLLFMTCHCR